MKRPFEEIVAEHGPTVLRVCRAVLRGQMPTMRGQRHSLPPCAPIQTSPRAPISRLGWSLSPITRRLMRSVLRAAGRRRLPWSRKAGSATGGWEPSDDDLWAALRALPIKQRQAVAYHHVAGLPYAEVAALVGGSTDAARRAAYDGIRALRRRYLDSQPSHRRRNPARDQLQ